ncbi:ead/Ea22-like family protein [Klebsiella pneumoniae]|uniref:ead/Ea22-like family protein n=1 Tax=Klebsiella pneumoniae TaxID=573 RepID=UPI0021D1532A|nr:ead/Ea22-like family protein [Klebsiella pneumoniae]MCU6622715.1 ead/Ea22-like family protein [Klebsiella pneumoniae]
MTDITELAQRARINAECGEHLSPAETMELVVALESEKRICATWRKTAKSTGEKLEKAQTINAAAEKLVRCKGRYHSEQNYRALAALFGVNTPDLPPLEHENVHYADAAEMEIAALRQRIVGLEESNAQVIQSRDHYKRMTEEGLKQLAESRAVTVKLPQAVSAGGQGYQEQVERILTAAGIKVEAE